MKNIVQEHVNNTRKAIEALANDTALLEKTTQAATACGEALKSGSKILFAGNGGSAADAQHLAAELTCRYTYDRPALAGIALTTDTSALTAIGNDYSYEEIFSRQMEALGRKGDVFVAISTSGNSANIIKAIHAAKKIGVTVIGLTNQNGGEMAALCDILLNAPSTVTAHVQECHLTLGHCLCELMQEAVK